MKRILIVLALSVLGWSKEVPVTIQVISSDSTPETRNRYEPSTLKCDNAGCTGGAGHSYAVVADEVHVQAMLNGDKVLLTCGERRRKTCYVLPPGTYTGELKGRSVWITSTLPATHESVKRRFDITGGW